MEFNRPELGRIYSGLYRLSVAPTGGYGGGRAVFELSFHEAGRTFTKEFTIEEMSGDSWLAINTHLLPNGLNHVSVRISEPNGSCLRSDAFDLHVLNDGVLADRVRAVFVAGDVPLVFDGVVDSACFPTDGTMSPWYDRPDALSRIDQLFSGGEISAQDQRELRSLVVNGYVELESRLQPRAIADANVAIDEAIRSGYQGYEYGSSQRLEHLHERYEAIAHLWQHPAVLRFLRLVFDAEPLPCQTLTYVFGSQQDLHQDTVHLTSFPAGYMCGAWIALEDIRAGSGELQVVPGSHRFERVYRRTVECAVVKNGDWREFSQTVGTKWERLFQASGLRPTIYRPKAGAILIWLDSLLHGGQVRNDLSLTRRSVVSHYFASGSLAYYDSTGLPGYVIRQI